MAELKPCPFCGGENIRINAYGFGYYAVECLSCGVETERYKSNLDKKAKEAIEAWNRRTESPKGE